MGSDLQSTNHQSPTTRIAAATTASTARRATATHHRPAAATHIIDQQQQHIIDLTPATPTPPGTESPPQMLFHPIFRTSLQPFRRHIAMAVKMELSEGNKRCAADGCDQARATRHAKYCVVHGRKQRTCSHPDCTAFPATKHSKYCEAHRPGVDTQRSLGGKGAEHDVKGKGQWNVKGGEHGVKGAEAGVRGDPTDGLGKELRQYAETMLTT
eukprot:1937768-Amphidinium_carterae.1